MVRHNCQLDRMSVSPSSMETQIADKCKGWAGNSSIAREILSRFFSQPVSESDLGLLLPHGPEIGTISDLHMIVQDIEVDGFSAVPRITIAHEGLCYGSFYFTVV